MRAPGNTSGPKPMATLLPRSSLMGRFRTPRGGKEILKLLLPTAPAARVILCSGYAESDLLKEAEQLGFRTFLAKPFSLSEFVSVLNKVLSKS